MERSSRIEQLLVENANGFDKRTATDENLDFIIYREEDPSVIQIPYGRRDLYGFFLTAKPVSILYGNRRLTSNNNSLLMINPRTAFACEIPAGDAEIFSCVVPADFFGTEDPVSRYTPFRRNGLPMLTLSEGQFSGIKAAFDRLTDESLKDFEYRNELIRNLLLELIYEILKLHPGDVVREPPHTSSEKIAGEFMKLLDLQFPISHGSQKALLRYPADYSALLFISTNHLNKALRTATGEGTSVLIAGRIIEESQVMLLDPGFTLREVARCMGFAHVQHFISFFRKHTGCTPAAFKKEHSAPIAFLR
ncbi:helix-turn-helix domain-containing protein [Mucilaginibacter sp. BJC16-A38]|uniref:helix-turn-helix domain-containing protein n=1 Tax=Mucilaginibacter phenanthrenivorans TaxID=1234842 RepID=UPI00215856CB|nr:helix-turn-helix domain-containing protein [Mucilaginibacter phenanthrenivorans]MCR8557340.1 helix-turn-helix domain-containing protein [Mucilaginibacter phenanthrenivorans]